MWGLTYQNTPYRVTGIDPGTDTLGVSVLDVDLTSGQVSVLDARTFVAKRCLANYRDLANVHGERMARLAAHEDNLVGYFKTWHPHSIISESPYMGKFPQAFAALTECMTAIRRAVWRYDQDLSLLEVDPPTAKKAVGAPGRGGDKDAVKKALLQLTTLCNPNGVPLPQLDEHSIDAIAVAYTRAAFVSHRLFTNDL